MILPSWFLLGLSVAALSSVMLLMQEKFKADPYALAFWNKATCAAVMTPFVLIHGLPDNPLFYILLGAGACMWAVSDVIFFRAVAHNGAGAVSRLLPASVIFSFLLWFLFDHDLLEKYLRFPAVSALIFLVLCLSAFFAMRLKKCPVSTRTFRAMWFVIMAATIGPVLSKSITQQADISHGPYAYVFIEALMMMGLWIVYHAVRRPVAASVFFALAALRAGLMVGALTSCMVVLNILAYYHIDNPAFIPAVRFTDAVMILLVYKLLGRPRHGDVASGIGLVACAAALVVLKAQIK